MSRNTAAYVVQTTFRKVLKDLLVEEVTPEIAASETMLSECPPFPFSRPTYPAQHTVFNLVPCDNEFERDFARWLDQAADVAAFSKLPQQFGFCIEYTDASANLRYYFPDFVVRLDNDERWLIETKGAETVEVAHKDRAARLWCENATMLTGTIWRYLKVPQKEYNRLQPAEFEDLKVLDS